jgi:hypothetical protein
MTVCAQCGGGLPDDADERPDFVESDESAAALPIVQPKRLPAAPGLLDAIGAVRERLAYVHGRITELRVFESEARKLEAMIAAVESIDMAAE